MDAVQEAWPHNFSQALRRPEPLVAPRHVKRAVEYIQAHPDNLVSGMELAWLSNVSQRALQEGFRRFVGMSIVAYQRQVRLERAHAALADGELMSITGWPCDTGAAMPAGSASTCRAPTVSAQRK